MEPLLRVLLVDGSGSMQPAWDAAWATVFDLARSSTAFAILVFKEALSASDILTVHDVERQAGRSPVIDLVSLKLIDYGLVLSAVGGRRLRRRPDPLITFSGRTPLNDAIAATLKLFERRYKRATIPYEVYVVSDNRDTASRFYTLDRLKDLKSSVRGLRRLVLVPVGSALLRYLDIYDEVQQPRVEALAGVEEKREIPDHIPLLI